MKKIGIICKVGIPKPAEILCVKRPEVKEAASNPQTPER